MRINPNENIRFWSKFFGMRSWHNIDKMNPQTELLIYRRRHNFSLYTLPRIGEVVAIGMTLTVPAKRVAKHYGIDLSSFFGDQNIPYGEALVVVYGAVTLIALRLWIRAYIFRIYYNQTTRAMTAISRGFLFKKQVVFKVGESRSVYYDRRSPLDMIAHELLGNLRIGSRRYNLDSSCFLNPSYRNMVLRE